MKAIGGLQMNLYTMQVKDVMQSPHFKSAEVIAGDRGLQKMFKWVHVVEICPNRKLTSRA